MTVRADDIVDVLLSQHEQLRQLLARVPAAPGGDRKRLLGELANLLHAHEFGEQAVVYPAVCDRTSGGSAVAVACMAEEGRIARASAELHDLGPDHPAFNVKFAAFHQAFLDHAAHEEHDEFPRLRRYVPTQRLHLMANELRNVQTMS
jgi:hypothetical protein